MKLDRFESFMIGLMVGFGVGGLMWGAVAEIMTIDRLQEAAIEAGVGEYNGVTGEFQWVMDKK